MKISDQIRQRIEKAGADFRCNNNISDYINVGDLDLLQAEVESKIQDLLYTLIIDTERDHNTQETAKRVTKM